MIDVYVKEINENEGHLLGSFSPVNLKDIPQLFELYSTIDKEGERCEILDSHFVLEGGCYFEIVVSHS